MGAFLQRRSVRFCRVVFRWLRLCALLLLLLLVMAGSYLHWVGLPDFLKRPILRHLHERGFEAQFSSMRLGWGPSVIVKNAFFQRSSQQPEPQLLAARADLEMTLLGLARAKIALKSLEVYGGKLQFPAAGQSNNALSVDNIHLELLFVSTNFVHLTNTIATFRGVNLNLNGELSHAEAVRDWKGLRPGRAKTSWQALLARLTDALDRIHFATTPRIDLDFNGDARDLDSIRGHVSVIAPDISTPWGDARKIRLEAACAHLLSTNAPILHLKASATEVATHWAQGSGLLLTAICSKDEQFNIKAVTRFSSEELDGSWSTNNIRTTGFRWDGTAELNGTNFHLLRADGAVQTARADSPWASARDLHLKVSGETNDPPAEAGPEWGFWNKMARYRLKWTMAARDIATPKLKLDSLALGGEWRAPVAVVNQLDCQLFDGHLSGSVRLDVATREAVVDAKANFDERRVTQLLTPAAQHLFAQYDWQIPPDVSAQLRVTLPAWTNRHPDWAVEVRPSLQVAGEFSARGGGSFRGVPVDFAQSHFAYTNRVWTLPDLRASRGAQKVELSYTGSAATHDFHFLVDSMMDPQAARVLLPPAQQHWFDEVKFSTPPKIHAEVWGRWHAPDLLGAQAEIAATNFVAHGQNVDSFAARLDFTNRFLRLHDARLVLQSQFVSVGLATADLTSKKIDLTNVLSSVGPELIRRVTAPHTPKFLNVIQFDTPPAVRLSGSFQIGQPLATDLRFEVLGRRFHYTNMLADTVSGGVRYRGRNVLLTNVQASLYNTGSLVGWCMFDYKPKHGTDFRCDFTAKDIDLPILASGLSGHTNKLEGMLDGNLVITEANSTNQRTWNGSGQVHVHNALLWDIKLFGIFSPILNAVSAGAGNSRAYDASADYVITNGVVATDDLVVHSTGFRLLYRGTVDGVTKQIDARAEAELLRDTRVLGPVLSALFSPLSKLFEYKITGNLRNPKMAPLFIPEPLMLLLRPFHTLKTMGESSSESGGPPSAPNPSPAKK